MTPDLSVYGETPSAPIALIATPGAEELAQLIDKRLITLLSESQHRKKLYKDTFILKYVQVKQLVVVGRNRQMELGT